MKYWLLLSGVLLIVARLTPVPQNGVLPGLPPLCPLKALTNWPCPGCGITRSLVLCAHGDWSAALAFHPLGPGVFMTLVIIFATGVLLLALNSAHEVRIMNWLKRGAPPAAFAWAILLAATWLLRVTNIVPFPRDF